MMEFPDPVSDARGTFRVSAMAAECRDGRWQGWLEFVTTDRDAPLVYATPVETRRDDRAAMVQWVSGLTHVGAQDALSRATVQHDTRSVSQLIFTLEELIEALDRRMSQTERVGETEIAADADRLRACAIQRIALLGRRDGDPIS